MKFIILFLLFTFSSSVFGVDVKTYVPKNAPALIPILIKEQQRYWKDHPQPDTLAGLIEQENCISLTSNGCWNPHTKLDTKREFGLGMSQLTKAYNRDGSIRFDKLSELKHQYTDLNELSWSTYGNRVDLQMRTVVIMSRDAAKPFKSAGIEALSFGDAGYNGGVGGVLRERRACASYKNCNPDLWFGNVELHCLKSHRPIYGNRSACDINREHVRNVRLIRRFKYQRFFNK